jgi:predicted kinase
VSKRYRLICVAPDVPDRGSYDDLDEAMANSDANFEVYDSQTREWLGPTCKQEYDEAVARFKAKAEAHRE